MLQCSADLLAAITEAMSILGMMELPDKDRPPPGIWHHNERLKQWFEAVKQRREHPDMQPVDDYDSEGFESNAMLDDLMGR